MRLATDPQPSPAELSERLRSRQGEIEGAVLTRVQALSSPLEGGDPEYAEGLRSAVSSAIAYGLVAIERGEERSPPPPPLLLAQARMAARNGVSLDTVLRRYCAGHTLLDDYLIEEAERSGLEGAALKSLLRAQAALLDRLLATVSEEHGRELKERSASSEQRRAKRIEKLLAGQPLDTAEIPYDFEGCHLGAIASGKGAEGAIRELATRLDRRLLLIPRGEGEGTIWAWLGSRNRADPIELELIEDFDLPPGVSLAIGEPAESLPGWRLTHRQAKAALPISQRGPKPLVRYSEVALLASVLQDDLLATSLRQLYLEPLERERDGGETARETLRAYFAAERNASSAAAILGVSRQAVGKRLQAIEERLGRSLDGCRMELEATLRLDELDPVDNRNQSDQRSVTSQER
jgi:hypothetical protein